MFNRLAEYNEAKTYTYIIIVPPASLPLTVAEVREHLKLNADEPSDEYLEGLIAAVRDFFEEYTTKILINTTFRTFRDYWCNKFELRKSKFQSLEAFKYFKDDSLVDVDSSLYYITASNLYSLIVLKDEKNWPTDEDKRLQAIQIDFKAGFGADASLIPQAIKTALLNHVAYLNENKGDCDLTNVTKAIPNTSKLIYDMWKIWRDNAIC